MCVVGCLRSTTSAPCSNSTPPPRTGAGHYVSLALSPLDGTPHVAYQDWGSSNRATVMALGSSGSWAPLGTAGFTSGAVLYTSLAFDQAGTPYLAFQMQRANCVKFSGGAWMAVGPPNFSAGAAQYLSLALSAAGVPTVAYSDAGVGYRATVVALSGDGLAWQPVGAAGFTPARADFISLVSSYALCGWLSKGGEMVW